MLISAPPLIGEQLECQAALAENQRFLS